MSKSNLREYRPADLSVGTDAVQLCTINSKYTMWTHDFGGVLNSHNGPPVIKVLLEADVAFS